MEDRMGCEAAQPWLEVLSANLELRCPRNDDTVGHAKMDGRVKVELHRGTYR